ncbi:MAG: GNAT family N-acetyltransferase [Phycisphaerae bacterium]|nr:GNAT family N-acetyltransferase [Phycisphaerae bacterium]
MKYEASMELVAITRYGAPAKPIGELPPVGYEVRMRYAELYETGAFVPPWIGYFAVSDALCVGTCGFKTPPVDHRVEIAYFTFPEHEGRGIATQMAKALIALARAADPTLVVAAQTLPEENASAAILRRLGFAMVGIAHDDEAGPVWEWQKLGEG